MSNEIEEILEGDDEIVEETHEEVKTEPKKGMDLSYLDKDPSDWTTDDAAAAVKATKTLQAQKNHFQTKAKTTNVVAQPNKLISKDDTDFDNRVDEKLLKRDGYSQEDVELLKDIQALNAQRGKKISLEDATKETIFAANLTARQLAEKKVKAQISGNGGGSYESPVDVKVTEDGRVDMKDLESQFHAAQ